MTVVPGVAEVVAVVKGTKRMVEVIVITVVYSVGPSCKFPLKWLVPVSEAVS